MKYNILKVSLKCNNTIYSRDDNKHVKTDKNVRFEIKCQIRRMFDIKGTKFATAILKGNDTGRVCKLCD